MSASVLSGPAAAGAPAAFEPRPTCGRCRRPMVTCYCAYLPSLEASTRLVILQHRRERDMPIGTAAMASLCVRGAELHVGVDFEGDAGVRAALSDPARPAYLLYPGAGARDVDADPPPGPITLVVVDGTWALAKKLLRVNPSLGALPRLAFTPAAPSDYRIRREPRADYVSTIEAVAHVLGALEGDHARFEAMLVPFRRMVEAQLDHRERLAVSRHKRARAPRPPGRALPTLLRQRPDDLLHVVAGASAWPRGKGLAPVEDLVQWVAYRPSTGERFEALVAPGGPLAPAAPGHLGLDAAALSAAPPLASLVERWNTFVRPSDVLCSWGYHGLPLMAQAGGVLPEAHVDLRVASGCWLGHRVGLVEGLVARLALPPCPPLGPGRAGKRLALQAAVAERMLAAVRAR